MATASIALKMNVFSCPVDKGLQEDCTRKYIFEVPFRDSDSLKEVIVEK